MDPTRGSKSTASHAAPAAARGPMRKARRTGAVVAAIALLVTTFILFRGDADADAPRVIPGNVDPGGFRHLWIDPATGEPARYDACQPIHYVINPRLAPPAGVEDVHKAFAETARASGLRFVYDGLTDETFTDPRPAYQPDRYGERWAPVLIAWSAGVPTGSDIPEAKAVGRGGSTLRSNDDGEPVYVSGQAVFDATAELRSGFGGRTWGQVILHEIGHIVGLDHIDDPTSVMNPLVGVRPAAWGDGDRAGLWRLGLGEDCAQPPPPG